MEDLVSEKMGLLLGAAASITGTAIGSMYGGPVAALLLGTTFPAIFNCINCSSWKGFKVRCKNLLDTIRPWGDPIAKNGSGYKVMTMLGAMFTLASIVTGTSYFAPAVAPYFVNFISKGLQAAVVDIVATNAVASWAGSMIDQQDIDWQGQIAQKRFEREERARGR